MSEAGSGVSRTPDPNAADEQALANAVADYLDLQIRGVTVDIAEYCRRFPRIEARLRNELESMKQMDTDLGIDDLPPAPENTENDTTEELPASLSGIKILSEIGRGGMGRVLLGHDELLNRQVAIKVLGRRFRGHEEMRTRFIREAQAMAQVKHDNIVRIHQMGKPDEIPHFVMEHIQGADLIEATRRLPLRLKIELMVKVVRAVDVLHRHGIIHRDLKPGNILVGHDLEPKVLDFGLAQWTDGSERRVTRVGDVMGTPEYFSPEQAAANAALDARSDIFSLGTILYVLLTGATPFRAPQYADQVRMILHEDPVLPRRINPSVPGDLQNICLKALEKNPVNRYASAGEMAEDLERYLAGESVVASPTTYSNIIADKVGQHLRELAGWKQDHALSEHEFDSFQKLYARLFEREDAWILEVRRLASSQVTLYLGAWILVLGAALVAFFRPPELSGTRAVLALITAAAPTAFLGIRCWRRGFVRVAIAYLLAFCLLLPTTFLVAFWEWKIFTGFTQGKASLELFHELGTSKDFSTNAQVWWAMFLSIPAFLWLRRYTRASVFSLLTGMTLALLSLWTLLRMGLIDEVQSDPSWLFVRFIPIAAMFFILATTLERFRCQADSRYFYPLAVIFTFAVFTGLALNDKNNVNLEMLENALPFTLGQHAYLFIINAGYYVVLQFLAQNFGSAQMRSVAKAFRFVIPGHVMTSCLVLGLDATDRWESAMDPALRLEARTFEFLLPAIACFFVFWSISKQMKNYLAMGLLFLAIGVVRMQLNVFKDDQALWPLVLVTVGVILMFTAANFAPLKLSITSLAKFFRRRVKS